MATPTTSDFLVVPINGTDLIAFYRGSNISRPLYLSYSNFLAILTQAISGGTNILLQTNSVDNPAQNVLNLIEGTGIDIVATAGGVTITATGGTSFITAITDTLDIDLDVTASTLSAALTTTGVSIGTYGTATQVPQITVDSKGRVTGVTNVAITAGTGTVTSITAGTGLEATASNPILVSGTIQLNSKLAPADSIAGNAGKFLRVNAGATAVEYATVTGTGTVTNVAATVPNPSSPAFSVNVPNPTTSPSIDITANGIVSQYIRGDGSLANFPTASGGGSSVTYYLNGSVSQGTFGGIAMREMNKVPVIGLGQDFTINADGYIQSFITDANDPNQLLIPAGNWIFEMWFSANSNGGSPKFYIDVCTFDGTTLTTIGTSSATPENITGGTAVDLYTTAVAVPQTTLTLTDRIAIRVYVIHSSKIIKLHTEDSHLCEVITTFTTGLTALNGLTDQVQNFATPGTTGTAPSWSSVSPTHTLNIPLASTASVTAGLLSNTDYTTFSGKQSAITLTTTGTSGAATFASNVLNIPIYGGGSGGDSIKSMITDVVATASSPSQTNVTATLATPLKTGSFGVTVDGVTSIVQVGKVGYVTIPYGGTITGWSITANAVGNIQFDIWSAVGAIPTTSIITTGFPALTGTAFATSTAVSGWVTTFAAGDVFGFQVIGTPSVIKNATLTLRCTKLPS